MSHDERGADAPAKPIPRRRRKRRRGRSEVPQLTIEDLAGPQLDLDSLSRRLGVDVDAEHRSGVQTVVERVHLEDIDDAERTEGRRAKLLRASLVGVSAYGLFVAVLLCAPHVAPPFAMALTPIYDAADAIDTAGVGLALLLVVSLIAWLRVAYANTELFSLDQPRLTTAEITWGFFIPWLNLYRPYQALERLHRCSDPEQLPDAPEVVDAAQVHSYRRSAGARRFVAASTAELRFPIGAFWAAYVTAQLVGRFARHDVSLTPALITTSAMTVAGVLGLAVVAAITARRTELMRRMRRILVEHGQLEG